MKHTIADACICQSNVFFFDNESQALCEFSVIDQSVKVIAVNEGSYFDAFHIFSDTNYLYIASKQNFDLLKYDLNFKSLSTVSCTIDGSVLKRPYYYDCHMVSDGKLWSFPNSLEKSIYYYDINENIFVKDVKRISHKGENIIRFSSGHDNIYWGAIYNTNIFIKYDLQKEESILYETSMPSIHISAICFDGTYLWMTSADSSAIIKCTETGAVLQTFDGNGMSGGSTFSRLYSFDSYIIGVPQFGDYILFIDKNENELKKLYLHDIDPSFNVDAQGSKILKCLNVSDKLIFFGYCIDGLIITDQNGCNARSIPILYAQEDLLKIVNAHVKRNSIILEENTLSLTELISVMIDDNYEIKMENEGNKQQIGKAIFDRLGKSFDVK